MTGVSIETLAGPEAAKVVEDLARLRVTVFREWPYLYEGSLDYERRYLGKYAGIERSTIVIARADGAIVGASTALPLASAEAELQAPFVAAGHDPSDFYYYGESVLLAPWRRRGIGVAFFQAREARARANSATASARSARWCDPTTIRRARPTMCRSTRSGPSAAMPKSRA